MGGFYPAVNFFVVLLVYFVFIYNNILPQMKLLQQFHSSNEVEYIDPFVRKASVAEVVLVIVSFHTLFLLFLVSLIRAMFTSAGTVPPAKVWTQGFFIEPRIDAKLVAILSNPHYAARNASVLKDFMASIPVVERKHNRQLRWCVKCGVFKPDRCHHCRHCDTCVLRMDHHCPWLSNCVGFHNYKFFLLTLFYALACLLFVLVDMFWRFYHCFRPIIDFETFIQLDLPIAIAYILCSVLTGALVFFFGFHMFLVLNAMTTIELKEKKRAKNDLVRHAWAMIHLKFDNGQYRNFVHIFGEPWMWFFPISPHSPDEDDGTYTSQCYSAKIDITVDSNSAVAGGGGDGSFK